ncbi:MAG: S1C family serine protease [Puniceicoccales bacterium]|jgi:S1-C subfamily serine protease|nr:S1C family serine protease [Puniceicoccales bacterium]
MVRIRFLGHIFLLLIGILPGNGIEASSRCGERSAIKKNTNNTNSTPTLHALSQDIQHLWDTRKNCVVKVMGLKEGSDPRNFLFGTGFFIDNGGHILTTATIVTEAKDLWVEYGGLSYAATLVGKDTTTNLAIIKLVKCPACFAAINLESHGDHFSAEGSLVIAIGCALGLEPAPILGLITGKNITFGDRIFSITYLRSDINICGGESGAPIFGSDGSLCGILIASLPELRSSFILPGNALGRICSDIIREGQVVYATAGFSARGQITAHGDKEVIISAIDGQKIHYSGAETLQIGDKIDKIDGQKINQEGDIADILFFKRPHEVMNLDILRWKEVLKVAIILEKKAS